MQKLTLNNSNDLFSKDLNHYGGSFSYKEKLQLQGVGSPKLIYKSGISELDNSILAKGNYPIFINLEVLKNGLLLRANLNQETYCFGIKIDEITALQLTAYKVEIRVKKFGSYTTKIVHRGTLEIFENKQSIQLSIGIREFKTMHSFLNKPMLKNKLNYTISNNPPEKDASYILSFFEYFM